MTRGNGLCFVPSVVRTKVIASVFPFCGCVGVEFAVQIM